MPLCVLCASCSALRDRFGTDDGSIDEGNVARDNLKQASKGFNHCTKVLFFTTKASMVVLDSFAILYDATDCWQQTDRKPN